MRNKQLKMAFSFVLLLVLTDAFGAGASGGVTALTNAAGDIKQYASSITTLSKAIGGVVGVIGAIKVYNKWSHGDPDINKALLGWGGACLFLILAPSFITTFFG